MSVTLSTHLEIPAAGVRVEIEFFRPEAENFPWHRFNALVDKHANDLAEEIFHLRDQLVAEQVDQ